MLSTVFQNQLEKHASFISEVQNSSLKRAQEASNRFSYTLGSKFTEYREKGDDHAAWVRTYCNLTQSKNGLKLLINDADAELASTYRQHAQHEYNAQQINARLDTFPAIQANPEVCRFLYEKMDAAVALVAARKSSGVRELNSELQGLRDEKKDCEKNLLRARTKLTDLENRKESGGSKDNVKSKSRSQRDRREPRVAPSTYKERKAQRAKVAELEGDIQLLDTSITDTERRIDAKNAALAPQQTAIDDLTDKIRTATLSEEDERTILPLLKQLDEAHKGRDELQFLLSQNRIQPYLQATGQVVLSYGQHSAEQLTYLLGQVRTELNKTEELLRDEFKRCKISGRKKPAETIRTRLNAIKNWFDVPSMQGNNNTPMLPAASEGADLAALALQRFARDQVFKPEQAAEESASTEEASGDSDQARSATVASVDDAPVLDKGKGIATPSPAADKTPAPPILQTTQAASNTAPSRTAVDINVAASDHRRATVEQAEDSDTDGSDDDKAVSMPSRSVGLLPQATRSDAEDSDDDEEESPPLPRDTAPASHKRTAWVAEADESETSDHEEVSDLRTKPVALITQAGDHNADDSEDDRDAKVTFVVAPQQDALAAQLHSSDAKAVVDLTKQLVIVPRPMATPATSPVTSKNVVIEEENSAIPLASEENPVYTSSYHFGTEDVDSVQRSWPKEHVHRPPEMDFDDEEDVTAAYVRTSPLLLSDQPYKEEEPSFHPETTTKPRSSAYTYSAAQLRQQQENIDPSKLASAPTAQAQSSQRSSGYTFSAKEIHQDELPKVSRSSTMPEMNAHTDKDHGPLPRRATEPTPSRTSGAGNTTFSGAREAGNFKNEKPKVRPHYRQHVNEELPTGRANMPNVAAPQELRRPDIWSIEFHHLPPAMQIALDIAVRNHATWTTIWHENLLLPGSRYFKTYYLVKENLDRDLRFDLSPQPTGSLLMHTVKKGVNRCHVLEILPPLVTYAPPPAFSPGLGGYGTGFAQQHAPMSGFGANTGFNQEVPQAFDREPGADLEDSLPSSFYSTDPLSPRYGGNRTGVRSNARTTGPAQQEAGNFIPESDFFRGAKTKRATTEETADAVPPHNTQRRAPPEPQAEQHEQKKTRVPESNEDFWTYQAKRKSGPRTNASPSQRNDRATSAAAFAAEPIIHAEPVAFEVAPIKMRNKDNKRIPPIDLLGTDVFEVAKNNYVAGVNKMYKDQRLPVPSRIPIPEDELLREVDRIVNDNGEMGKLKSTHARATLANAKQVIEDLQKNGFDLAMLSDFMEDLGYSWNNTQDGSRPAALSAAFASHGDRQVAQELRQNRRAYESMDAPTRTAALQKVRDDLLASDADLYKTYLNQKYQDVFSYDIAADAFRQMLGRVFSKLGGMVTEMGATKLMEAVAEKNYTVAQKKSLLYNLELQEKTISEASIARVPGFKQIFDARVGENLSELEAKEPAKFATPEMRAAQRDNLRNELMGKEGRELHEAYLLAGEHRAVLQPIKQVVADKTWHKVIDNVIGKLAAEKS